MFASMFTLIFKWKCLILYYSCVFALQFRQLLQPEMHGYHKDRRIRPLTIIYRRWYVIYYHQLSLIIINYHNSWEHHIKVSSPQYYAEIMPRTCNQYVSWAVCLWTFEFSSCDHFTSILTSSPYFFSAESNGRAIGWCHLGIKEPCWESLNEGCSSFGISDGRLPTRNDRGLTGK